MKLTVFPCLIHSKSKGSIVVPSTFNISYLWKGLAMSSMTDNSVVRVILLAEGLRLITGLPVASRLFNFS